MPSNQQNWITSTFFCIFYLLVHIFQSILHYQNVCRTLHHWQQNLFSLSHAFIEHMFAFSDCRGPTDKVEHFCGAGPSFFFFTCCWLMFLTAGGTLLEMHFHFKKYSEMFFLDEYREPEHDVVKKSLCFDHSTLRIADESLWWHFFLYIYIYIRATSFFSKFSQPTRDKQY